MLRQVGFLKIFTDWTFKKTKTKHYSPDDVVVAVDGDFSRLQLKHHVQPNPRLVLSLHTHHHLGSALSSLPHCGATVTQLASLRNPITHHSGFFFSLSLALRGCASGNNVCACACVCKRVGSDGYNW